LNKELSARIINLHVDKLDFTHTSMQAHSVMHGIIYNFSRNNFYIIQCSLSLKFKIV